MRSAVGKAPAGAFYTAWRYRNAASMRRVSSVRPPRRGFEVVVIGGRVPLPRGPTARWALKSLAFPTLIPVSGNLAFRPLSCQVTSRASPLILKVWERIQNLPFHQNSTSRATVQSLPWRVPLSTCTASSACTQKALLAPARFASGPRRALFASQAPAHAMRPPRLSQLQSERR